MHVYNKTTTTVFCTKPESSATVDLTLTGRLDRRELQEQILKTEIQTAANRAHEKCSPLTYFGIFKLRLKLFFFFLF